MNEYELALYKRAKDGDESSARLLSGIQERRTKWFSRSADAEITEALAVFNKRSDVVNLVEWLPPHFQQVLAFEEGYKAGLQASKPCITPPIIPPSITPLIKPKWYSRLARWARF